MSFDDRLSGLVLAYHGCEKKDGERILGGEPISRSQNDYDWLGHGAYFWENDPERALEWAKNKNFKDPFAIGAVLDLGICLNLLRARHVDLVGEMYQAFLQYQQAYKLSVPQNRPITKSGNDLDMKRRQLDCAVIEFLHANNKEAAFESVRGMFPEDEPLYKNAGFKRRNHIQICVRDLVCIKGYFRILKG